MKYKIKKMIYKFSKFALRVFIFFSCVLILVVPAFAQEYSSWGQFMGSTGQVDFYVSSVNNAQVFTQFVAATGGRVGSYSNYVDIQASNSILYRTLLMRVSNAAGFTSLNNNQVLVYNSVNTVKMNY